MRPNYKFYQKLFLSAALAVTACTAMAGDLSVGASRMDISAQAYPDGNIPERNYSHEWLYIRAIVLDNGDTRAALIGADLSGIRPDEIYIEAAEILSNELDIPVANIIMSATHTHSGLREQRDPVFIRDAIIRAVREASADMQPASMSYGEGMAYLNVNRDVIQKDTRLWTQESNLDGPSDKTVAVLSFFDMDGSPIAGYMNYAMHPVSGYLSGFPSGDFAGAASRHVEQAFNDEMVMVFVQGASGDQNPLHLRTSTNLMAAQTGIEITGFEMSREPVEAPLRAANSSGEGLVKPDQKSVKDLKRWMDAQGQYLGEEVIRVMTNMDYQEDDVEIAGSQQILTCPGRTRTNSGAGREGSPGTYEDGPDVHIRLGLLGINEIALGYVNAEVYNQIQLDFKEASPLNNTMMVTLANGRANSGYIPTDDAFGRHTFQVLGSRLYPGCAQTGIVNTLTDMVYDYMGY
jgi:neutral ceramidase